MNDEETRDYRCTVTLYLEDAPEEIARKFFAEGADVEGVGACENYLAMIENPQEIIPL